MKKKLSPCVFYNSKLFCRRIIKDYVRIVSTIKALQIFHCVNVEINVCIMYTCAQPLFTYCLIGLFLKFINLCCIKKIYIYKCSHSDLPPEDLASAQAVPWPAQGPDSFMHSLLLVFLCTCCVPLKRAGPHSLSLCVFPRGCV